MIRVQNVRKSFGEFEALKGISFEVKLGEIVGLLGPNGAGKTTAMRVCTGFMPASSGSVYIGDHEIHDKPEPIKEILGYLPELPPLYQEMTVSGYLQFVARLKHVKNVKKQVEKVINDTGLIGMENHYIQTMSKGYKQRVGLAQALINDPKFLILDEPTVGLDPNQIIEIRELIKRLRGERTIILSTHILPEVSEICDRVIIIDNGQIVGEGTPDSLRDILAYSNKILLQVEKDGEKAKNICKELKEVNDIEMKEENRILLTTKSDKDLRSDISKKLISSGLELKEIRLLDISLEDIFKKLTKEVGGKNASN